MHTIIIIIIYFPLVQFFELHYCYRFSKNISDYIILYWLCEIILYAVNTNHGSIPKAKYP